MLNFIAQLRAYRRGVVHTTFNPERPGAVRIHLIPPRFRLFGNAPYTVILNGWWLLPLGYSWAVLLSRFIDEVNKYDGKPMKKKNVSAAKDAAVKRAKRVYPFVSEKRMREDLDEIITVLFDIARGRVPDTEIEAYSLRENARNMTAPHRMDLLISSMTDSDGRWKCNLHCANCYAAGQEAAQFDELSTEDWKDVIDKCRDAGIPQLTFTGGEPTLRSDLVELIAHAKWHVTRLNTNGLLLSPALCKQLREASLDAVQVTLYSNDPSVHDRLVGREGAHKMSIEGIKNALAAGLNLSVNTPLCGENRDYVNTLSFLRELGVRYVSCSGLIETGSADSGNQLSVADMNGLLTDAAVFCADNGMELSFTSPGRADPEVLRSLGLTVPMCGACLSNMAIAPDGSIMPCQSWLSSGASLGNILTDSWRSIWNSDLCRGIRSMPEEESLFCPLRKEGRDNGNDKE